MRALIGLTLLFGLGLTGVEHFTAAGINGRIAEPVGGSGSGSASAQVAASSAVASGPRAIFQTVAAIDPVQVASGAPRAQPIAPIIAKAASPTAKSDTATGKPAAKSKTKPVTVADAVKADATLRPGFKLTCTAEQKLDTVKKRCIALKGTALATAKGNDVR